MSILATYTMFQGSSLDTGEFTSLSAIEDAGSDFGFFDSDGFNLIVILIFLKDYMKINLIERSESQERLLNLFRETYGDTSFFLLHSSDKHVLDGQIAMDLNDSEIRAVILGLDMNPDQYLDMGAIRDGMSKLVELVGRIPDDHFVVVSI